MGSIMQLGREGISCRKIAVTVWRRYTSRQRDEWIGARKNLGGLVLDVEAKRGFWCMIPAFKHTALLAP